MPGVSHEYLKQAQKRAHIRYFLRPSYIWMRAGRIENAIDLKNVMLAFLSVSGIFALIDKITGLFRIE